MPYGDCFRPTDQSVASLAAFFRRIARPPGVRLLWESRGLWPADLVADLCAAGDLTHAVDPFVTPPVTTGYTYYRLHGITGSRHVYSNEELARLRDMLPAAGETYVMFDNIPRAEDARRFERLLSTGTTSADPLL